MINERVKIIENIKEILSIERSDRTEQQEKILADAIEKLGEFKDLEIPTTEKMEEVLEYFASIIKEQDGMLVIDGNQTVLDNIKHESILELDDIQQKVLVHATNYFPENHTILNLNDGKKEKKGSVFDNGVLHETTFHYHRHTCHFVTNGIVENTGDGHKWDTDYVVVEPCMYHENEIVSWDPSDTYIDNSVKLSDEAVLLVKKEKYETLTEEEKEQYNVVLFEGDFRNALINYLVLNNVPISIRDANSPNHSRSIYFDYEVDLGIRDKILSYMIGEPYTGDNLTSMSKEELVQFIDLFRQNDGYHISSYYSESALGDDRLLYFLYASGIKINDDDTYSFIPEEINYQRFINHYGLEEVLPELNEIKNVYIDAVNERNALKAMKEQIEFDHEAAIKVNNMLDKKAGEIENGKMGVENKEILEYLSAKLNDFGLKFPCFIFSSSSFDIKVFLSTANDFPDVFPDANEFNLSVSGAVMVYNFNPDYSLLDNIRYFENTVMPYICSRCGFLNENDTSTIKK